MPGYGAITFLDATFTKTSHLYRSTWDTALAYNANLLMAYFSRSLSNWAYASSRVGVSPFAWIDSGTTSFEQARGPVYVADQLAAFRRWGMGGLFGNYGQQPLNVFDYGPYTPGMQAAATPGIVDSQRPRLNISSAQRLGGVVRITGNAKDNLAVRSVLWTAGGSTGAVPMTWKVTSGDYTTPGFRSRMVWTVDIPAAPGQVITLRATDIKGLKRNVKIVAP